VRRRRAARAAGGGFARVRGLALFFPDAAVRWGTHSGEAGVDPSVEFRKQAPMASGARLASSTAVSTTFVATAEGAIVLVLRRPRRAFAPA